MKERFHHAHEIIDERCNAHMSCMHACPTHAIRIRKGTASFINELCVDCGECINVCPENAWVPISDEIEDFSSFNYRVAFPSSILYTQFNQDVHPKMIHHALKNIGFDEVIDSSETVQELGFVLRHHLKTPGTARPLISSFCPTVVRLVQVSYPNLVHLIEPFDVPRELVAKRAKERIADAENLSTAEIGVIYIAPCPAKIVSIKQPAEKKRSWIDGAVPIREVYNLILPEILKLQEQKNRYNGSAYYYGRDWGLLGSTSRTIGYERCLAVAGIAHLKKIFDDIENSKLRNVDFVEALACMQGCVSGAFCVENPYIARHNSILMEQKYDQSPSMDKKDILEKYRRKFYHLEEQLLPRTLWASSSDLAASIKKMRQKERILMKLPQKNCGLCGAPTCGTFAQDCAMGDADLTDCVFFS